MTRTEPGAPLGALTDRMATFAPALHAVLRIGAGLLFMEHGLMKLFGWFGGQGPVPLFSMMGLAGILETFGGLLVVIGLLTRPVALILALEMLVAYFMAHAPKGLVPIVNQGELALLYALVFAYLAAAGSGPFSVDDAMARRRRP